MRCLLWHCTRWWYTSTWLCSTRSSNARLRWCMNVDTLDERQQRQGKQATGKDLRDDNERTEDHEEGHKRVELRAQAANIAEKWRSDSSSRVMKWLLDVGLVVRTSMLFVFLTKIHSPWRFEGWRCVWVPPDASSALVAWSYILETSYLLVPWKSSLVELRWLGYKIRGLIGCQHQIQYSTYSNICYNWT